MEKIYRITLTEEQARVVQKCLEFYFRLMMGQDSDFADEIASINRDIYNQSNPNHKRLFESFLNRRDHIRAIMKAVFQVAYEPLGYLEEQTNDMMVARCIWDALRIARGCGRYPAPLHTGGEPVPAIEVKEKGGDE